MGKTKKEGWTRAPTFTKYYGTVFGLGKAGRLYRLDIGNEKAIISEDEVLNIAECQLLLDEDAFEALYGLMTQIKKEAKKLKKKK